MSKNRTVEEPDDLSDIFANLIIYCEVDGKPYQLLLPDHSENYLLGCVAQLTDDDTLHLVPLPDDCKLSQEEEDVGPLH